MQSIDAYLKEHPFFQGFSEEHFQQILRCASTVTFYAAQDVFNEGAKAEHFYIIRSGSVALQIPRSRFDGVYEMQRLGEGDVLGWSWILPPYTWHFDAKALEMTRAIVFDAACVKKLCEADLALGYEFMKRFAQLMLKRLNATRYRLVDQTPQHS